MRCRMSARGRVPPVVGRRCRGEQLDRWLIGVFAELRLDQSPHPSLGGQHGSVRGRKLALEPGDCILDSLIQAGGHAAPLQHLLGFVIVERLPSRVAAQHVVTAPRDFPLLLGTLARSGGPQRRDGADTGMVAEAATFAVTGHPMHRERLRTSYPAHGRWRAAQNVA